MQLRSGPLLNIKAGAAAAKTLLKAGLNDPLLPAAS